MTRENELLLVVDVQEGFVSAKSEHVVRKIHDLIGSGRFENVAFTQFVNVDGSPYEEILGWRRLKSECEQRLAEGIRNQAVQVFVKDTYTALTPAFKEFLLLKDIETVYLAGIDTDCCVLSTAIDLFQLNIRPVVLSDYCASNGGKPSHDAALLVLERLIGKDQIEIGPI